MKLRIYPGLVFALILSFCLIGPSPASAFSLFNRDVSKAKKFIKAGMYPQAIAVLEKRINEEPDDVEAHFLLADAIFAPGT